MKSFASNVVKFGPLLVMGTMARQALAAVDVEGVETAIEGAETSAQSVGTTVIGVVAGLAVVGIVIGLVRKL